MNALLRPSRPTLGVLVGWHVYGGDLLHPFLDLIFRGIGAAAKEHDCNILLSCGLHHLTHTEQRAAWPIHSPEVDFVPVGHTNTDGLIVIPSFTQRQHAYLREVAGAGHPMISIGHTDFCDSIRIDNRSGIFQAVEHLWDHGHRYIAFVGGRQNDPHDTDGIERLEAFREALHMRGLPVDPALVAFGNYTASGGRTAIRAILERHKPFTAVIVCNDESAIGVMQTLREWGQSIPEQIAVIGFDNQLESSIQATPLTTVHVPLYEMGVSAVARILDQIKSVGSDQKHTYMPVRLVIRKSCGCQPGIEHLRLTQSGQDPLPSDAGIEAVPVWMNQAILNETRVLSESIGLQACQRVFQAFRKSIEQMDSDYFEVELKAQLATLETISEPPNIWYPAILILRHALRRLIVFLNSAPNDPDEALVRWGELLCEQAQYQIAQHTNQFNNKVVHKTSQTINRLGHITGKLHSALKRSEILQVFAEEVGSLQIRRMDIILFEEEAEDSLNTSIFQSLDVAGRGANAHSHSGRFDTFAFPPAPLYPPDRAWQLALLPLLVDEEQIGFVSFLTDDNALCATLVWHLSSAFRNAQFYEQAEEASRLKSRFLSTVSHELRTPLNLITGLSELILSKSSLLETPAALQSDIQNINYNAQHLSLLISDVLDLNLSEQGHLRLNLQHVDLTALIESITPIVSYMVAQKGLEWQCHVAPNIPLLWGDPLRLRQVILNLISNAVKFTDQGYVALHAFRDHESVRLEVQDTGMGVPPSDQESIFEDFRQSEYTTRRGYGGLGLGLSICKRIVQLHQGRIGVESAGIAGEGATFYAAFPIPAAGAGDPQGDTALNYMTKPLNVQLLNGVFTQFGLDLSTDGTGSVGKTILIVDDDTMMRELHGRVIKQISVKFNLLTARNGREALALMQHTRPDLVLLDLIMPEMDGFRVLEFMQHSESLHTVPVIVLTTKFLTEDDMAKLNQGISAVLTKGVFTSDEIAQHFQAALVNQPRLNQGVRELVRKAIAYIHEHYTEPISRRDIAHYVNINEDYLTRSFNEEMNLPPMAYLNRYRVYKAKLLLEEGKATITEVAMRVGFSDNVHFSRAFRREVGLTPTAYRRRYRI
jgi:signal transduction histidine kinase/DNA-binding LacI/PurR family transcriptional regulator/AraC-like DNA-binding protein